MDRRQALSGMGAFIGSAVLGSQLPLQAGQSLPPETAPGKGKTSFRREKNLSGNWKFQVDIKDIGEKERWFDKPYADSDWGTGFVPQAWDSYEESLWEYEGPAWYKTVIHPADVDPAKKTSIHFGRVMQYSKVWLNDKYLGENIGGHLPFDFNLTDFLKPGVANTLTIRVDNTPRLEWLPAAREIEWIQYGGILGKVILSGTAYTYIDDMTIITEPNDGKAVVSVKTAIVNESAAAINMELTVEISRHAVVSKKTVPVNIAAGASDQVTVNINIENAALWSPDTPVLYTASASLKNSGATVDEISERFGIRKISVEGTKMLLNGQPLFIKGVNRYDDYGRLGPTVPEKLLREELTLIKNTGVNLIRVHYPQSPDLLSLYDEYGFLMMEEIPFCWWGGNDDVQSVDILKHAKPALAKMIKRDKNHPCVIIWSMCNECITVTEPAIIVLRDLLTQAKALDPTRLATYVLNGYEDPVNSKAYDKADIIVINKYDGALQGEICTHTKDIEEMGYKPFVATMIKHRKNIPDKPMFMGEFGSQGIKNMRGDLYYSEDFQAAYNERIWDGIREIPGLSGGILWCWADYYHRKYFIKYTAFGPYGVVTADRKPKNHLRC